MHDRLTPEALDLAVRIRACTPCHMRQTFHILCARHRAELDRMFPEQCTDPDCHACRPSWCPSCGHALDIHRDEVHVTTPGATWCAACANQTCRPTSS